MKKLDRKLDLHRETLHLLAAREIAGAELRRMAGHGPQTSERIVCCNTGTLTGAVLD